MAGDEKQEIITLGNKPLDPDEEARHRDLIARARKGGVSALKGREAVGGVPRPQMPILHQEPKARTADAGAMPMPGEQPQQQGVQPRPPGSPLLRAETVQALQQAQQVATKQEEEAVAAEQPEKEEENELLKLLSDMQGTNSIESILNNPKRRKAIEDRCTPMRLQDLVMYDEVKQVVPIVPDEFVAKFRSITPAENLYVKKLLADAPVTTQQYLGELFNLYSLTFGLLELNGQPFMPVTNSDGDIDDKAFQKKFKQLTKKSSYVIGDLALNYGWFDIRVRKLINPDELKNG